MALLVMERTGDQARFATPLKRFVTSIDSLASTLPLAMTAVQAAQRTSAEMLSAYVDRYGVKGKDGKLVIPNERWLRHNKLSARRQKFETASRTVPSSFLVSLVSQFDALLADVVRVLFAVKPDALNLSEKALTLAQLLNFQSIDAVREYVIEKEVESVLRKSHAEQFDWLESKLGITLRKGLTSWPYFVELTERRNLLVHTGGIVTSQYLAACKAHGVPLDKDAVIGKALRVSPNYFDDAYGRVLELGTKLVHVIWRKLLPDERSDADSNLIWVCYDLLEDERYELARELLDFSTSVLKQYGNEELRRRFVINRAQAYKWLGRQKEAYEIIDAEDWSASSELFKLASAVLRDDYRQAAIIVERLGKSVEQGDYREWPLYKEFRKTPEFLRAYERVYGEPFAVADAPESAS